MKILIQWLLVAVLLSVASCNRTNSKIEITNPFFGVVPTAFPQLLVPELIASPAEEYNGTFSPDGTEFYYTTDIPENAFITFTELQEDNSWSEPKVASFSGVYSDYDPLFSPDGEKLFFSSSRPAADNMDSKIWFVERINGGWSEPEPVSLTGSENREYYSSLTRKGDIYFNIWSTGNIFKAQKTDSGYKVELLPEIVNGNYDKGDPFISPDEDYLIFRGYRNDSYGRGDLYICFKINGQWTEPENLGEPVNSKANEMCPYVTTDGKIFIFASSRIDKKVKINPLDDIQKVHQKFRSSDNGETNIYYMSTDFIEDFRKKHMDRLGL